MSFNMSGSKYNIDDIKSHNAEHLTTNTSDKEGSQQIANIIKCLSENPNGITKEEICKLQELAQKGYTDEFRKTLYKYIYKSKTVRDISELMKIESNLTLHSNEAGQGVSLFWSNFFDDYMNFTYSEEDKKLAKNILQAAGLCIGYGYYNVFLETFCRKFFKYSMRKIDGIKDEYKKVIRERGYSEEDYLGLDGRERSEFLVKLLEVLNTKLQKMRDDDEVSLDNIERTRRFLHDVCYPIQHSEIFDGLDLSGVKKAYVKLLETIHSIDSYVIEKTHNEELKKIDDIFR